MYVCACASLSVCLCCLRLSMCAFGWSVVGLPACVIDWLFMCLCECVCVRLIADLLD